VRRMSWELEEITVWLAMLELFVLRIYRG